MILEVMGTASDSGADYLFVYGVLRRSTGRKINCILTRSGIFLGDGTFRGRLYKVGYYPGAVRSECESDTVKGDVYLLQDPEKVLEVMDEFDGCRSTSLSKGEFYRDKFQSAWRTERRLMPGPTSITAPQMA